MDGGGEADRRMHARAEQGGEAARAAREVRRRRRGPRDGVGGGCKDRWTKRGVNWAFFKILKQIKATLTYAMLVRLNLPTG